MLGEQVFYMPKDQRDLTGATIADDVEWTGEEILV